MSHSISSCSNLLLCVRPTWLVCITANEIMHELCDLCVVFSPIALHSARLHRCKHRNKGKLCVLVSFKIMISSPSALQAQKLIWCIRMKIFFPTLRAQCTAGTAAETIVGSFGVPPSSVSLSSSLALQVQLSTIFWNSCVPLSSSAAYYGEWRISRTLCPGIGEKKVSVGCDAGVSVLFIPICSGRRRCDAFASVLITQICLRLMICVACTSVLVITIHTCFGTMKPAWGVTLRHLVLLYWYSGLSLACDSNRRVKRVDVAFEYLVYFSTPGELVHWQCTRQRLWHGLMVSLWILHVNVWSSTEEDSEERQCGLSPSASDSRRFFI